MINDSGARLRRALPLLLFAVSAVPLPAQDPLQDLSRSLKEAAGNHFGFTLEQRTRWEERYGVGFGKNVNQQDMLNRIRVGAWFEPVRWLHFSAMGQDSRVPFYGVPAPSTLRDSMDLQEAWVELRGRSKTGFGARFGREMLNFGEGRLIGSPQWGNLARTFDAGRVYYRTPHARFEVLAISAVKIQPDAFNQPVLGDRIWGTYDTFTALPGKNSLEVFALRHSQNRIGGWAGAGTLGTNTFSGRLYGPLPAKFTYTLEAAGQTGHLGLAKQRAWAWYVSAGRNVTVYRHAGRISVEYKEASGTAAGSATSGTFDQLSPANHDKFGHQDLFGWRNLRTLRSVETLSITKKLALNLMYSDEHLASAADSLYNIQGTSIALSKAGTAGTHVGQELDTFATWQKGAHLFGAGFGHFFRGEFVNNTTPHVNPRYFYVFQQYTIN